MEYLSKNLAVINEQIQQACTKSARLRDDVLLLGVTKTYEADIINASIELGITDIAENRVQEIIRKYDDVTPGVNWHLIGHLQTNKVKYIIDKVSMIHSVDSMKLAKEINKRAAGIDRVMDVLIQVNVAKEEQKFGVSYQDAYELAETIDNLTNVRVRGFMNIAPFVEDKESLRGDFKQMRTLLERFRDNRPYADCLSMGMSNDFDVAIEEGTTMVRIGTGIYGKRDYVR